MTPRRWDFISANAGTFGVQRLCRVLDVSRSGYYRWQAGASPSSTPSGPCANRGSTAAAAGAAGAGFAVTFFAAGRRGVDVLLAAVAGRSSAVAAAGVSAAGAVGAGLVESAGAAGAGSAAAGYFAAHPSSSRW